MYPGKIIKKNVTLSPPSKVELIHYQPLGRQKPQTLKSPNASNANQHCVNFTDAVSSSENEGAANEGAATGKPQTIDAVPWNTHAVSLLL